MIFDIIFICFIIAGGLFGYKMGFTRSLVRFIGILGALVCSFLLKNPVSEILMSFMPFFPFGGLIKGVTVLNIVLYEMMAFSITFGIMIIILKIVSMTSKIFEKIISMTIILGLPSKLLGATVGMIKNYIIVFFVLYFLAMPQFSNTSFVKNSKLKDLILKNTPVLSIVSKKVLSVADEFKELTTKYKNTKSANKFNLETLDLLLKYKVTTVDTVERLEKNGKIKIKGIERILKKYK